MRRRVGLIAMTAAAVAACNAITGLSDDYHLASAELDGGDDASSASDGRGGGSDAPGDDTTDSSAADAPSDAPRPNPGAFCTDAGAGVDGSNVVFCSDFEADGGPDWGWTTHDTQNGTLSVVDDAGFGSTRGLRAYVSDAGVSRKAALVEVFQALPSAHYDLSFSFRVKGNELPYLVVGLIGFNVNGSSNYYGLAEHNELLLDISSPPGTTDNIGVNDTPKDTWRKASITLDRVDGGTTYNGTMSVDGTLVDSFNALPSLNQFAEIRVGTFFTSNGPGTAEVFFDNVVVHRR